MDTYPISATMQPMSKNWIYWRIGHIIIDVLGVYGAFLLAYFARVGWIFSTDFPIALFALLSGGATVVWIGFLIFSKYYRIPPRSGGRKWFDFFLAVAGGLLAVGMLIVTYFFPREILFSRLIGLYIFLFGIVWLALTQWIFRSLLAWAKKQEKNIYRTLIVGANRVSEKLIQAIETNPYAPYKIIGVIDPYGLYKSSGFKLQTSNYKLQKSEKIIPLLGKLDKLESVCEEEGITALIQCDGFEHTLNLISFCDEKNIKFQFDPALRGIFEDNLRVREVAGVTMISFVQRDFSGRKKLKFRLIDWVLRQVFDVD
jgi:FlaA1/EpsC-like NDP-sugar epimerase